MIVEIVREEAKGICKITDQQTNERTLQIVLSDAEVPEVIAQLQALYPVEEEE